MWGKSEHLRLPTRQIGVILNNRRNSEVHLSQYKEYLLRERHI